MDVVTRAKTLRAIEHTHRQPRLASRYARCKCGEPWPCRRREQLLDAADPTRHDRRGLTGA
jgi:hypothetical protein